MASDFQLESIHGVLYTSGNVQFSPDGRSLHTAVHNYLNTIVIGKNGGIRSASVANSNIQCLDISPDGDLAIVIGSRGLGVFWSFSAGTALDTISFPPKCDVGCVKFSPCGKFIAIGLETTLQIYNAPEARVVSFQGCHRIDNVHNATTLPITHIDWSRDSLTVLISGADARATIYPASVTLGRNRKGQVHMVNHLIGHRASLVSAFFAGKSLEAIQDNTTAAVTVAADGALIAWKRTQIPRKDLIEMTHRARKGRYVRGLEKRGRQQQGEDAEEDEEEEDSDEDVVPESFLEKSRSAFARQDNPSAHVTKGAYSHLPFQLQFVYEPEKRHFLKYKGQVSTAAFQYHQGLVAVGYTSGIFAIHQPFLSDGSATSDCPLLHSLSVSSQSLSAACFSPKGDLVAFAASHLNQLVVWDWKSETFALKEQSHYYDINCAALTADGSVLISGGEDGKTKVWKRSTGQCFGNFAEHTAAITGLVCSPSTNAFFTSSRDGTCRGFDLMRHRCFRTFVPDEQFAQNTSSQQFCCVGVDPSGELLAAGSNRSNTITLWSVRTGKVITTFSGHEEPTTCLAFHPSGTVLVSGSVDKTLRIFQLFSTGNEGDRLKGDSESVSVASEVLDIGFSLDGRRCCVLIHSGEISIYDSTAATELLYLCSVSTVADATGGWIERIGPQSANANFHFTKIAVSPCGDMVVAGGDSKWICLYRTNQGYLVNKWPVTNNLDFDGAEEQFNFREVTEAGVFKNSIDVSDPDPHVRQRQLLELPGATHKHYATTAKRKTQLAARTSHLTFSAHGRDFVAATSSGLQIYSVDHARTATRFIPLSLSADITTESVLAQVKAGHYGKGLLGALSLGDMSLGTQVLACTPPSAISVIVPAVPQEAFPTLLDWIAAAVALEQQDDQAAAMNKKSTNGHHLLKTSTATVMSCNIGLAMLWADAAIMHSPAPLVGHSRSDNTANSLRTLHRAVARHRQYVDCVSNNLSMCEYLLGVAAMGNQKK